MWKSGVKIKVRCFLHPLPTLAWFCVVLFCPLFFEAGSLTETGAHRVAAQKVPGIHLLLSPLLWSCWQHHYTWISTRLPENQTHAGIFPTESSPSTLHLDLRHLDLRDRKLVHGLHQETTFSSKSPSHCRHACMPQILTRSFESFPHRR